MSSHVQTSAGVRFDLLAPDPSHVLMEDIAMSLSRLARFTGHSPYSVAQHSVIAARVARWRGLTADEQRCALMHDAPEAYIGDISRPLRRALGDRLLEIEAGIWSAVARRFRLPSRIPESVRRIDDELCVLEARSVFVDLRGDGWPACGQPSDVDGMGAPWSPAAARMEWRRECERLELR